MSLFVWICFANNQVCVFRALTSVGAFFNLGGIFMQVTQEMYTKLFNAMTDAKKQLEEAFELLERAQIETEEMYISQEN